MDIFIEHVLLLDLIIKSDANLRNFLVLGFLEHIMDRIARRIIPVYMVNLGTDLTSILF